MNTGLGEGLVWQEQGMDMEGVCRAVAEFLSVLECQEVVLAEDGEVKSFLFLKLPEERRFALEMLKEKLASVMGSPRVMLG